MCVDPATATAIASVAITAGEGIAGYAQGKATEKAFKNAARQELTNAVVEEAGHRREARKFAARQRVQALKSGGDVASGSLADIAREDTQTIELNALMRRYAGQVEADSLKFQGRNAARTGAIGGAMKFMQAGVEAVGSESIQDWGIFRKKTDRPTKATTATVPF